MASYSAAAGGGDKYRLHITRAWRGGAPPNYDLVNKLFEEERKNVWAEGSLENRVEKLVKTWEMEMVHHPLDFLTIDPNRFTVVLNGTQKFSLEQMGAVGGSYNLFFQTPLPPELRIYDPDKETEEGSHRIFKTAFPRGFALEVMKVYTDKPNIAFEFRHFGYFEGEFMGNPPTGELVEFHGNAVFQLDPESELIVKAEFFFDRAQLLAPLIKGRSGCPFAG